MEETGRGPWLQGEQVRWRGVVTTILETKFQTYEPINKLEIPPPTPKISDLLLLLLRFRAGAEVGFGAHLGGGDL